MFNRNGNPSGAKKPVIRREKVKVPVDQRTHAGNQNTAPSPKASSNRFQLSQRSDTKTLRSSASRTDDRPKEAKPLDPARRALGIKHGVKRKSATPDGPMFSSDESDAATDAFEPTVTQKRPKRDSHAVEGSGSRRLLVLQSAFEQGEGSAESLFIHGADVTSGEYANKFHSPWDDEDVSVVELQYPTVGPPERFELKSPKNSADDYRPLEDMIETVKQICEVYLPADVQDEHNHPQTRFVRRFGKAWRERNRSEVISTVHDFNTMLKRLVEDGTTRRQLAGQRALPRAMVSRIMTQIYSRTVSPKVEGLRRYENGSDNVYGELLSRFCSDIFNKVQLHHEHVFVDLGSGVGNVVLQAALEAGCESWGIEMMDNPCRLAELQAREFPARTRLWGIHCGSVHLLQGDFTDNAEIAKVLQRADVVLVNNQAFTPALNNKLRDMFLDLKPGCKVVSLKPFVPQGHKITMRNIGAVVNLFVQTKYEYFSESVSWTNEYGNWYVAEKDSGPLERFMKTNGLQ